MSNKKNFERISKIAAVAAVPKLVVSVPGGESINSNAMSVIPPHIDLNGVCYDITLLDTMNKIPDSFFDSFYSTRLPSFEAFQTGKISISSEDLYKIVQSHHSYINDVSQITGRPYDQVLMDFAQYHQSKEVFVQPTGWSAIIHKASNGFYVSGAALQSVFATATSHMSGVTGMSLVGAAPGLVIFVPLVGGVFFGSLERLAANTPAQPALVLARDACLITPKIAEIAYNEVFIGPILRKLGIDAPLNVTSMLRFGNGTKRIMGGVFNSTLSVIAGGLPNLKG